MRISMDASLPEHTFKQIPIEGSFVKEFSIVLRKTARFVLLHAPEEGEPQLTREYELRFVEVSDAVLSLRATPWLRIISHHALADPDPLRSSRKKNGEKHKAVHYKIVCEEGEIEIVAGGYDLLLVCEMPHVSGSDI